MQSGLKSHKIVSYELSLDALLLQKFEFSRQNRVFFYLVTKVALFNLNVEFERENSNRFTWKFVKWDFFEWFSNIVNLLYQVYWDLRFESLSNTYNC